MASHHNHAGTPRRGRAAANLGASAPSPHRLIRPSACWLHALRRRRDQGRHPFPLLFRTPRSECPPGHRSCRASRLPAKRCITSRPPLQADGNVNHRNLGQGTWGSRGREAHGLVEAFDGPLLAGAHLDVSRLACHADDARTEAPDDIDQIGLGGDDVLNALVGLRGLVDAAADKGDIAFP